MALSDALVGEVQQQNSDDGILHTVTIAHPDLPEPLYLVNEFGEGTLDIGGQTYIKFQFEVVLPSEPEDGPQTAQVTFSNISQEIGATIRALGTSPTLAFRGVRLNDLNSIEYEFTDFKLRGVTIDILTVSGTLARPELDVEPVSPDRFIPNWFPHLGRSRQQ